MPVTRECAGNGRARLAPRPVSQPWLNEAIGTAEWTGTPLAPILAEAGLRDEAAEVALARAAAVRRLPDAGLPSPSGPRGAGHPGDQDAAAGAHDPTRHPRVPHPRATRRRGVAGDHRARVVG